MSFSKQCHSFSDYIHNKDIFDRAYWCKGFNYSLIYPLLLPVMLLAPVVPVMAQQLSEASALQVQVDQTQAQDQSVSLSANQELVVTLDSNPASGHSWELEDGNQSNFVQLVSRKFQPNSDLLGAPGKLKLTFKAKGVGATALRFVYRHLGQSFELPAKEFKVNVHTAGQFVNRISNASGSLAGNQSDAAAAVVEEVIEDPVAHKRPPAPAATNSLAMPTLGATPTDSYYNACANGACTPVKNQGSCGSCWAFSTVGSFESSILKKTLVTKDLSEQYLISCNSDGWSCSGGWFGHNYHLNKKITSEPAAGAVYESDFPYKAANVACGSPHVHNEKLISWKYVQSTNPYSVPSVAAIKQAISTYGPISAAVCVGSNFQKYTSGVFSTNESCGSGAVNHAIVLVGWDDTKQAWYLRNSWGANWGENGYMWIKYNTSNVGYAANYVSY